MVAITPAIAKIPTCHEFVVDNLSTWEVDAEVAAEGDTNVTEALGVIVLDVLLASPTYWTGKKIQRRLYLRIDSNSLTSFIDNSFNEFFGVTRSGRVVSIGAGEDITWMNWRGELGEFGNACLEKTLPGGRVHARTKVAMTESRVKCMFLQRDMRLVGR